MPKNNPRVVSPLDWGFSLSSFRMRSIIMQLNDICTFFYIAIQLNDYLAIECIVLDLLGSVVGKLTQQKWVQDL